jgi:hypothetical protein
VSKKDRLEKADRQPARQRTNVVLVSGYRIYQAAITKAFDPSLVGHFTAGNPRYISPIAVSASLRRVSACSRRQPKTTLDRLVELR